MLFDWRGRPALMFPTLAFVVERPGARWTRCNASQIEAEAEPLNEDAFWERFGDWSLGQFPVQFSPLDRPSGARPPPARAIDGTASQPQQQQQPAAAREREPVAGVPHRQAVAATGTRGLYDLRV